MAQDSTEKKTKKPRKKRWYSYIGDAYRVAVKSYPNLPWILLATALIPIILTVVLTIKTGSWIFWPLIGIMITFTLPLLVLTQFVRKASYQQIDGRPGAAGAVINQIRRGWVFSEEPVRFNPKTQDLLFRLVGRPGVVIVSEGPANRVNRLIADERAAIKRVAPSAPIHVIQVGHDEGQTPISDLQKALRKLPKQITNEELSALAARLSAVRTNNVQIPKGIDPKNVRANRRAMRG
ncbi:MAG: DUF4191 domain-containing protein [Arcanobacterium sp.]|nr:DUF4191 domain-containing protein [Arcanobacterium sp.]